MIDFYGLTSPNVQKIFIMLEETGLPYNFKPVDVWASAQHSAEFAKLNPNKKIPVIVDTEGPGGKPYTVFESGAILMYLAEKTGKFMPKDMAKKYDVIQWLMVQMSGIGPAFGNFTHFNLFAPKPQRLCVQPLQERDAAALRAARHAARPGEISRRRRVLDRRHGDVPVDAPARRRTAPRSTASRTSSAGSRRLSARPAIKAMIAKQADIKSSRETATDDNKDRFFNRGKYARA